MVKLKSISLEHSYQQIFSFFSPIRLLKMTFHQPNSWLKLMLLTISVAILLCLTMNLAYASNDQPADLLHEAISLMTCYGFENVNAFVTSDTLSVEYENRIYFREKDAIGIIIPKLLDALPTIQTLVLIPKKDNAPLFQITILRDEYQAFGAKEKDALDTLNISPIISRPIYEEKSYNSSFGKIDVTVYPFINIALGRFNDPFIPYYSISPEASIFWGNGIRSLARVQFLLYDELKKKKRSVVIDGLYISYTYRKTALKTINFSAGYFGMNRYGLSSEAILFGWGSNMGIGGSAACLGNIYYFDDVIYYTKIWNWTALLDLYYRLPSYRILLSAKFGRFLHQDNGVFVEAIRYFDNISMGVFSTNTDQGYAVGLRLQFLTYPRRNMKPYYVRPKLPTLIKTEYRDNESIVGTKFSPQYNDFDNNAYTFWLMDLRP